MSTQPECTCATLQAKRLDSGELQLNHRAGCPREEFLRSALTRSDEGLTRIIPLTLTNRNERDRSDGVGQLDRRTKTIRKGNKTK
jgi:hypothetical protein